MKTSRTTLVATLLATASLGALINVSDASPITDPLTDPAAVGIPLTYTETNAGQTLATASPTAADAMLADAPLSRIVGTFSSGTDADLFVIDIDSPTSFLASTVNAATEGGFLDTALFLFDLHGNPIATNDDANGAVTAAALPVGNSLYASLQPGTYYLGISLSGNEPLNALRQTLFAAYTNGDSTSVRGPAAHLGSETENNFDGLEHDAQTGGYEIDLTGVTTDAAPEPSSVAAIVLGGLALLGSFARRHRVRNA